MSKSEAIMATTPAMGAIQKNAGFGELFVNVANACKGMSMLYKPCPFSLYVFLICFVNSMYKLEISLEKRGFETANLVAFLRNRHLSQVYH
jgi:hypothetical protein